MAKALKTNSVDQPFYGDVLARSLIRIGVPKYEAYEMAHEIWKDMSHKRKDNVKIAKAVEAHLKKKHPKLIKAYRTWREIMKQQRPIIILIGGGTGIGTSTLAMRLAWLLEINHTVGTDAIREVVRQFVNDNISPLLHVSSFRTASLVKHVHSPHERLVYGFTAQSKKVLTGIEAIIKRSISENLSTVIEGIHLIPGEMKFLDAYRKKAMIIEIMLDVDQVSTHRAHLLRRHKEKAARNKEKYLDYFKEIRLIRDYLVKQAKKNRVSVIENYDMREAEKAVLNKIYNQFIHQK
jgi:2-phosphoglycerate kinase